MSGGFGADFTQQSLLTSYLPDLTHLPTTNDGVKMGEAIGGKSIGLKWVQVHPTVLVKPEDPDAKIKLVGTETLLASVALSWMRTASASRTSSAVVTTSWVRCGRASRLSEWP